jgi:hypothetical protein
VMPILKFISINRAVLLASIVGISSIYAAPHEAQKPADNSRHLRIIQTSTSFVHTEFSGTLGIAELQKRFRPGGWSTKDPGQNDGPAFWLSTATDSGFWKENIVATTFWIGEPSSSGNPSNTRSAWDSGWMAHYGGRGFSNSAHRSFAHWVYPAPESFLHRASLRREKRDRSDKRGK